MFLILLCISAIFYYGYAIYAAIQWVKQPQKIDPDFHPPLTILKPVCGLDWETYENLSSFCQQDYPEYEILFAVQDQHDQCLDVIQKIKLDFPTVKINLVRSDRKIGTNLKVCNLANAVEKANSSILIIADSDIRVNSDYLNQVIQPLKEVEVGVVTCLYRSRTEGILADFETLEISTQFHPRVLTARQLEGVKFALGSTIVIRREVLDQIGGFAAIANDLADDFQLGNLPTQLGYKVILSHYIVEHLLANVSFSEFISRQVRWAKCIRSTRFWGYFGLIFTQGTVTSLLCLMVTFGSPLSWIIFGITWGFRLLMAWVVGVKILQDPVAKKYLWLVPLRDIVSFAIWCYGFFGQTIEWRGHQFKLVRGQLILTAYGGRQEAGGRGQKVSYR